VKPEGQDYMEHPYVDGRIILIWMFRNWDGDMDWTDVAQDRGTGGRLLFIR